MSFIRRILKPFFKGNNTTIIPIQRNDLCFCGSGLKYKKCHAPKLEPKNKIACKFINNETGNIEVKIIRKKSLKVKSNLRWVDVGVGSSDKIE